MKDTIHETIHENTLVRHLVLVMNGEQARDEIQQALSLKSRDHFRKNYLSPALEEQLIEMTIPDQPKNRNQRYRLTAKGKALQLRLNRK